jgi:copper chaperone
MSSKETNTMADTIEFMVTGETKLHCQSCEQRVVHALRRLAGVQDVQASAHTQRVAVTLDPGRVTPD